MDGWHYIVVLGLLCIVYASLLPKRSNPNNMQEFNRHIEGTLEAFAAELDDSNSKLVDAMTEMKRTQDARVNELRERLTLQEQRVIESDRERKKAEERLLEVEHRLMALANTPASIHTNAPAQVEAAQTTAAADRMPAPRTSPIRDRYAELFTLYAEGKSTEAIAKKLGMNKGEVQLIVTLAEQEGQTGVEK